jgi:PAS domain S-box-containing protein
MNTLDSLRDKAEALTTEGSSAQEALSPDEAARLIHELKVHQIELQIQNEELRRSQEELIHSRDRFGILFNQAPVGYLVLDANGTIEEANETFCIMLGIDTHQIRGRGLSEFLIPSDRQVFLSRFRSVFKHPHGKSLEFGLLCKSGIPVFVHLSAAVLTVPISVRSKSADPHLLVTISDITQRKQTDNALRESEEKYRVLFNNELYAICIFDLETLRFLDANDAYVRLYGYSKDELLGSLTIHDITVQHGESDHAMQQAVSSGTMYIPLRYHKKQDGTVFPVEIVGGPYIWRGKKVMFAIARDISERLRTETALKESKRDYDEMVAQVPVGIYKIRMKSTGGTVFDYVSPRFCEMMNLNGLEVLNNPITAFDIVHPEDINGLFESNEIARKNLKPFQWEGRFIINGQTRFIHMESLPIKQENGDIVWTGTQRDITHEKQMEAERKELEYRLQQAKKAESLGRMAGAVAHHFNNQLYVVLGNLEMALMDSPRNSDVSKSMIHAQNAAEKAAKLSRLMLTYLGQVIGKREPLDVSETCRIGLPLLLESIPKTITLKTDLPSYGPIIKANTQQIQLVLSNLITNAWEAVGENPGNIGLSVRTVTVENIPVTHRFPADWQPKERVYACLEVTDTGCGIRNEDIEKVFDPFYTTKFTGRGLGLSVIIGIVCAYDGGITVESHPGRGSAFRIFLPISPDP